MFSYAAVPSWMLLPLLFPSFTSLPEDSYVPSRPCLEATSPESPKAHPTWQTNQPLLPYSPTAPFRCLWGTHGSYIVEMVSGSDTLGHYPITMSGRNMNSGLEGAATVVPLPD